MPEFLADLHLHTAASDGALPPGRMMRAAADAGMRVVAVTDHDTSAGVAEAIRAGEALGLTVLSGIELSAGGSDEIHLLGYGFRPDNPKLDAFLISQQAERRERMYRMLEKLTALGMPVPPEETGDPDGLFMGRMNLAHAMAARGYVPSARAAFDGYLNPGGPAYVPRRRIEVPRGIELLRSFGAVVSLAHPGRLRMDETALLARLPGWIEAGLSAVEAYHASHDAASAIRFDRMARKRGLLVTGGSDCHGREGVSIGCHMREWRTAEEDVRALIGSMHPAQ